MAERATGIWEITCDSPSDIGCAKNEKGHRYRGVRKCWGCEYATRDGKPYGPRRKQPAR